MPKQSPLERTFATLWRTINGPELQPEYKFHPARRWRFDFAAPDAMVGIELEGGTWGNGRHNRGDGYAADCAKYNAAGLAGWQVFRFTADMLANDPYGHLLPVAEYIIRMAAR